MPYTHPSPRRKANGQTDMRAGVRQGGESLRIDNRQPTGRGQVAAAAPTRAVLVDKHEKYEGKEGQQLLQPYRGRLCRDSTEHSTAQPRPHNSPGVSPPPPLPCYRHY